MILLAAAALADAPAPPPPLPTNRTWDVLPAEADPRERLRSAAGALGDWTVAVAGVDIDGAWLEVLAATPADEPLLRAAREHSARPLDLDDLLLFLDDVLVAGEAGRRGEAFTVPSGRARAAGVLVHPDDVFKKRPRRYGNKPLSVDAPQPQASYPQAQDGDPSGPEWTMRFQNPSERPELYAALAEARPASGFASRVASLVAQLEHQGAEVYVASTVRSRERGYLMWGAFELGRAEGEKEVDALVGRLEAARRDWGLTVPITWRHPEGWQRTVEGARIMADTYDVVYATESGARWSKHYGGIAADFVAIGLPRALRLYAPDGVQGDFDLSDPDHTRDLSLSPALIDWVEAHFGFEKLRSDYPHWNDTRPPMR